MCYQGPDSAPGKLSRRHQAPSAGLQLAPQQPSTLRRALGHQRPQKDTATEGASACRGQKPPSRNRPPRRQPFPWSGVTPGCPSLAPCHHRWAPGESLSCPPLASASPSPSPFAEGKDKASIYFNCLLYNIKLQK